MHQTLKFIINRSELAAGTRGASLGPDAIFTAARTNGNLFFSRFEREELPHHNRLLDEDAQPSFAKHIDGLTKVYEDVSASVAKNIEENYFPLLLSGDHGSAGGTIAGLKKAFPTQRIGVIWIDAHGDLHTPYTTPSGNMHGMPLATALNEDNLECKINDVPAATQSAWNTLKNIGYTGAKILPEDLVFIAVRDTEAQEDAIIERLNIKNFTVQEVTQRGTAEIVHAIQKKLADCDRIYISFDVDSMDPELSSYGTGTPVQKGLSPQQAHDLLNGLAQNTKTCCIEFVEVNPCLDNKKNTMAEITFGLIESVANTLNKYHGTKN